MQKDDIIRMAQEAGLYHFYDSEGQCTGITNARLVTEDKERWDDRLVEMLAPFAALVAAAEREACAKVCEEFYSIEGIAQNCAAAIRARKAALAEPQIWVCPEAADTHRYDKPGHCEDCGKTLVQIK